ERHVLRLGGERRDAAVLERLLQMAEVVERAAQEELRLALLAGRLAQLLEAVIDQLELELLGVELRGVEAEGADALEQEEHAAVAPQVAVPLVEVGPQVRDGARRVVGRGLDEDRDAVR